MKVAENISRKCRNIPRNVPFESFNVVKKNSKCPSFEKYCF
jgi:hypothetical protein